MPVNVISDATQHAYDKAAQSAEAIIEKADEDGGGGAGRTSELDGELGFDDPNQAAIIRFVNAVLSRAIKERASDIHIEPIEKDLVVRFRDRRRAQGDRSGRRKVQGLDRRRVKIMGGLNIAEKRLPQDGRIRIKLGGPRDRPPRSRPSRSAYGERVVMRILEKGEGVLARPDRDGTARRCTGSASLIQRPHGILLVTGPTGSGKSTTLYSAIAKINTPGPQHPHDRGPGRVRGARDRPGPGQRQDQADVRERPPGRWRRRRWPAEALGAAGDARARGVVGSARRRRRGRALDVRRSPDRRRAGDDGAPRRRCAAAPLRRR